MKVKHIVFTLLFAFASSVATSSAYLRPDEVVMATIPFDFYAGDRKLPAGTYTIEFDLETHRILLRDESLRHAMYLAGIPTGRTMDNPQLLFVHSGDTYILQEVQSDLEDVTFHSGVLEKILANRIAPTQVEVALNR